MDFREVDGEVDEDKVEATLRHGVLHLQMPQTQSRGRKITVK